MPTPTKTAANMTKHMTQAEREAREQAEENTLPSRVPKRPRSIPAKSPEARIWNRILADMKGYDILDILDTDALEIYCRQLTRLKQLQELFEAALSAEEIGFKTVLSLSSEIKGLEAGILNYATKLGLTPDGRARLARKTAELPEDDPDGDMFA